MDMQYELEQSEEEFGKIMRLLKSCDELPKEAAEAEVLAWRMFHRLQELRLRHPD